MFVLPGDTTPLSAKTSLGKKGCWWDPAAGGKWLCSSTLTPHHFPWGTKSSFFFLLQNAGFQLCLLGCGCAGSWANIPGEKLSCHLGAGNGAGLFSWDFFDVSSNPVTLGWGTGGHWDREQGDTDGGQWDPGMENKGTLGWGTGGHWNGEE